MNARWQELKTTEEIFADLSDSVIAVLSSFLGINLGLKD